MKNKSVLVNSVWIIFEKVVKLILALYVTSLIAKEYGPDTFGLLSTGLTSLVIITVMGNAGLQRIIVREVSQSNERSEIVKIYSTAFYTRLVFCLMTILVAVVLFLIFKFNGIILVILCSVMFVPFNVYESYSQAHGNFKTISITKAIVNVAFSLMKITFINGGAAYKSVFCLVFLEFLFIAIIYTGYIVNGNFGRALISYRNFDVALCKKMLSEGKFEVLAGVGGILFMKIDVLMIAAISGMEEAGIYSAATKVSEVWYFIPLALISATYVKLSNSRSKSYQEYMNLLQILMTYCTVASLIVAIFLVFMSESIIGFIFGGDYARSAIILTIHGFCAIFVFMGSVSGTYLVLEKKLRKNFNRNIFGLIVNAVLNFILIPFYGAEGAVVSTLISIISAFFIYDLIDKELHHLAKMKLRSFLFFKYLDKSSFRLLK